MKTRALLTLAGATAALWALGATAQETVLENFETPKPLIAENAASRGFAMDYAQAPEPRGASGRLSFQANRHKWVDFQFRPFDIPGFATACEGTFRVMVYGQGAGDVASLSLRLVDAEQEVFQWVVPVDFAQDGWRELVFNVSPGNINGHWAWASKNTGVPAPPMRFSGFAVTFKAEAGTPGTLFFDDLRAVAAKP